MKFLLYTMMSITVSLSGMVARSAEDAKMSQEDRTFYCAQLNTFESTVPSISESIQFCKLLLKYSPRVLLTIAEKELGQDRLRALLQKTSMDEISITTPNLDKAYAEY